ncbi:uncharacterized protein Z519_11067 [Cladophialophora bantiana CBS 173.52]|uniref:Uncharacterized protein n=1 Tax=Cladophialophora bantiana (strain ATCC 10958 / CBS 173.52 / CDC B-1940 / NIH 8579) TaxID=1442370 RepID=A0A0D2H5F4_CLAB1|nr:uncharacterized protein Z519_11067 [Cladophialophora bantiana CBS 173.52]KIW88498.1 hypothetical protein Z519_11067 [Cladophialophora bantiana CBS 173.52]
MSNITLSLTLNYLSAIYVHPSNFNYEMCFYPLKASSPTDPLAALQTIFGVSSNAGMADQDKSALDASKGSVGSQFKPEGSIGQMGQKVGGPLSSEGAVGKKFTPEGSVGGTAQSAAEQMQGDKKPIFDKDGAVGKQFKPEGAIGSVGEVSYMGPVTKVRSIDSA